MIPSHKIIRVYIWIGTGKNIVVGQHSESEEREVEREKQQ